MNRYPTLLLAALIGSSLGCVDPTEPPSESPSTSPTPSASMTPSATASSATPSPTDELAGTPTGDEPTLTESNGETPTLDDTSPSPMTTGTPEPEPSPSTSGNPTSEMTPTPMATPEPTAGASETPGEHTAGPTNTPILPTQTPMQTPGQTLAPTADPSESPEPTLNDTPLATQSPGPTADPSATPTEPGNATFTPTPTEMEGTQSPDPTSNTTPTEGETAGEITPTPTPFFTPEPTPIDETAIYYDPYRLIEVEIEMDPDEFEEMSNQQRYIVDMLKGEDCGNRPRESPYTWFEADVVIDGERIDTVGIRKKGFIGSSSTTKPGIKLKFDKYVDDQELAGMERFTLNNGVQDPSLIHQCMAYGVFADIGVPAPRCNYARVTMNGEYLGVYIHIEPIKKKFLATHFPDNDGDLYEGTLSDFRDEFWGSFQAKTGSTDEELGPIIDIRDALKVDDDELVDSLSRFIDIDAFITFWAAEVLTAHWDGYAGNSNNFLVYREPDSDLNYFIPWGADGTFYQQGDDNPEDDIPSIESLYANSAIPFRLYGIPEMREVYLDRLTYLMDYHWDESALLAEANRMEELVIPHALDPERMADGVQVVRNFIQDRRAYIEEELDLGGVENPTVELREPFCMPLVGGLEMSFETTWDSLGEGSPHRYGEGELYFTNEENEVGPADGGAIAGFSSEAGAEGSAEIGVWVSDGFLGFYRATLNIPGEWMAPGTYEVDGLGSFGWLDFTDPRLEAAIPIGIFVDGPLVIDEVDTESGAVIRGSCTADLYGLP